MGVNEDMEKAFSYYLKSAELENAYGQYSVAMCYKRGIWVKRDYERMIKYLRLSADQGYASAQCDLANCYEVGMGVEKNYMESIRYYRMASLCNSYARSQILAHVRLVLL